MNVLQRSLDILVLLAITYYLEKNYIPKELSRVLAIFGSCLVIAIFSACNMYKSWRGFSIVSQIRRLFFSWLCVLFFFNIIVFLLSDKTQFAVLWPFGIFASYEIMLWALAVFVSLASVRLAVKPLLMFIRKKGYNQRHAVIVGAGHVGKKLAKYFLDNRWMGIRISGFFDDQLAAGVPVRSSPTVLGKVLGSVDSCFEFALTGGIDMVFIALPLRAEEKINKLIWNLGTKGVPISMVPDLFAFGLQRAKIHQMGELHLIDFNLFPGWKRPFDIVFSLLVVVLTLPLWLLIVALIKIEDGGPVFYRHPRVMESGKRFNCLKFRTMHVDADQRLRVLLEENADLRVEWERTYKLKNDPRVTRIGRFLRRTSLDELPQFLNVLAGQMSVVGARPIVPEELEKYYKDTAISYCAMKPGITGPWQAGKRSDTEDYAERVKLDCWYVLNSSLWVDIRIIFKTIWNMLRQRGAY